MPPRPFRPRPAFLQGAILGGLVSFCYITIVLASAVVPALFRRPPADIFGFIVLVYTLGAVIGIVPASLIGGLTTTILARCLSSMAQAGSLTMGRAMLTGALIALVGSAVVSLLFWLVYGDQRVGDPATRYLFYVGVPSLIYIAAGAWAGRTMLLDARSGDRWAATGEDS